MTDTFQRSVETTDILGYWRAGPDNERETILAWVLVETDHQCLDSGGRADTCGAPRDHAVAPGARDSAGYAFGTAIKC